MIMLHGMIPAAFFATLMRRYLDSLAETPIYVDTSTVMASCLGTSAILATAGVAMYGLLQFKNKIPFVVGNPEMKLPLPQSNDALHQLKKQIPNSKIRKRRRKGKQWFLKNMRHYKSKYGQRFGKIMHQLLGSPYTESPVEPLDSDYSDDECPEVFKIDAFHDYSENDDAKNESERNAADQTFPDDFSCRLSTLNEDDSIVASKDDFDDVDDDADLALKRNSSLDLKDLLRENFERQKMRQRNRKNSSVSTRSSRSHNSSKSDSNHSRSSARHNKCISRKSSRRRSNSAHCRCRMSRKKCNSDRGYTRSRNISKKTRSGRCYDKMTS